MGWVGSLKNSVQRDRKFVPALPHPIMGVGGVREAHDHYFVSPKEYKFARPVLHCLQACRGVGSVALCSVGFRVRVEC